MLGYATWDEYWKDQPIYQKVKYFMERPYSGAGFDTNGPHWNEQVGDRELLMAKGLVPKEFAEGDGI
jgi:hypothetical protein